MTKFLTALLVMSVTVMLTACITIAEGRGGSWVGTPFSDYLISSGHQPKQARQMKQGATLYYFEKTWRESHTDYTCTANNNTRRNAGTTVNVNTGSNSCLYYTNEICRWQILEDSSGTITSFGAQAGSDYSACRYAIEWKPTTN